MTPFDFIAEKDATDAQLEFLRKCVDVKRDIVSFVDDRLGWNKAGEFFGYFRGSFNLSIGVQHNETNERVLIRFPLLGKVYGPWRERKVDNEVMVIQYLAEHTSIPVPRVYDWGLTRESPHQLGPFIIEEFMKGKNLGDVLKKPTKNLADLAVLDPDIGEATFNVVYEQIAGFLLELSRLQFPRIGAISKDPVSGEWAVTRPPLTYDMNEVVTYAGFPAEHVKDMIFDRASDYFAARAQSLQLHLNTQRNLDPYDEEALWNRYVARHCFAGLIPTYSATTTDDSGPFRLFCDDLRPSNMLVDPETMRITAVLDLEFTNVMPAQFASDLPWWLILRQPGIMVGENSKQEFLQLFEPRKEQFLRAMERAEARSPPAGEPRLSARMRNSWESGRFWFDMASRCSFDIDVIYWEFLHEEGRGEAMLGTAMLAEKRAFLKRKKEQLGAYLEEKQNDRRFAG